MAVRPKVRQELTVFVDNAQRLLHEELRIGKLTGRERILVNELANVLCTYVDKLNIHPEEEYKYYENSDPVDGQK